MEFIETRMFTKRADQMLSDEDYRALQMILTIDPLRGDLIPGGGGLRKIRWRASGRQGGKRGGIRVIYYCLSYERLIMVFIYDKLKEGDMTRDKLMELRDYLKKGGL